MGIDLRVGKKDHYTRYKVYSNNTDIRDSIQFEKGCLGILHAKDITGYNTTSNVIGGNYLRNTQEATIETTDKIEIKNNYFLYALAEKKWYKVVSYSPNSHNPSQRYSARPILTTQIVITRLD